VTALHELSAVEAAARVRQGAVTVEELVGACLARIREREPEVQAWAALDPEHALAQARAADDWRRQGRATGPLHGVPVGVKDIFDTGDLPTECGTPLFAGRTPARDATVVALLRAAGAIVLGKTVTTELATRTPGKTRNPHHPGHTPGGSSSGSAAAVAAGMVPLAVGSQTTGSVIRPAAYCGVFGFKPTHGLIPRHGMLRLSRTLDHVGLFARSIEDLGLLAEQVVGHDERDPDSRPRARPAFRAVAAEEPPLTPMLGLARTPWWDRADEDTRGAFEELAGLLGDRLEEVELSPAAAEAVEWHALIREAEMAASLEPEWDRGRDLLSEALRVQIARGREVRALDYQRALARIPALVESLEELFLLRYDALVTPAAPGPAPAGLASTGDPIFCALWTLCGMPALSVPLARSGAGLPIGVQLVGPRHGDARLLRTATWLAARLGAVPPAGG
jgi:Asp-tRNA(Asn)/Glu-tRNA(Gln) amidotransferase A subunit family amidase